MTDRHSSSPVQEPTTDVPSTRVALVVDGEEREVLDTGGTLLDALREQLGITSPKDGCAPQGQCGCCTVLVDGQPRVACVTPLRRVQGRAITTVDGLDDAEAWSESFCATGASQCGFCTPGIIVRLAGLAAKKPDAGHPAVEQALLAHVCRCTGWRTILDAWDHHQTGGQGDADRVRDLDAATAQATLEGATRQLVEPGIALGRADFADDTAPDGLVGVVGADGSWIVGTSLADARDRQQPVQGRRTTAAGGHPFDIPDAADGDAWAIRLQTSWVEPGYLETDASWAEPGGPAADPLINGGAFGAKTDSVVADAARQLANDHDQPVRIRLRREDTVRMGPKRPPLAAGLRADGTGVVRVARTPGIAAAISALLPDAQVEEVDVAGPPTSVSIRAAGWAEATALAAAVRGDVDRVTQPGGGQASCAIAEDGTVTVTVWPGSVLDDITLRSYCIGAAHQALSLVTTEGLVVDDGGEVQDLTIRSFGILRAIDTPRIEVTIVEEGGDPCAVSDAVFAATMATVWLHQDTPPAWPTQIPVRR